MFGVSLYRRKTVAPVAIITSAAVALGIVGLTAAPANALSTDVAVSEGQLLSGSGAIDLDKVTEADPAYSATPSGAPSDNHPLKLDVLSSTAEVDLGNGLQLLSGASPVLRLGVDGQYAKSDTTGAAYAASGALNDDGSIDTDAGSDATNDTTVNLTPFLGTAGVDSNLISALELQLGAISAGATGADGATTGDYRVAGGHLIVTAPAVATLHDGLSNTLRDVNSTLNKALGSTSLVSAVTGPLGDALDKINLAGLGSLSLGTADTTVALDSSADLPAVLDAVGTVSSDDGAVSIDLSKGTVDIDLAALLANDPDFSPTPAGTLDGLPADTHLLTSPQVQSALNGDVSNAASKLVSQVTTAATKALDGEKLTVQVNAGVKATLALVTVDAGNVNLTIEGTVGGFLGLPGSTAPVITDSTTTVAGLDLSGLLGGLTSTLLPAVTTAVGDALTPLITTELQQPLTALGNTAGTALQGLAPAIQTVADIIVNRQEKPGDFTTDNAGGADFTERAIQVDLVPAASLATLNLASATVRSTTQAAAISVEKATTAPGETQTVDGTAFTPGAPVTVTYTEGGTTLGTVTATPDADGTFASDFVVPTDAADGVVTVTAAQGTRTDTATFDVVAPLGTITGQAAISGTAQVGQKLTADPGTWAPAGVTLAYNWTLPDGTSLGTTGTLVVPASAAGKVITLAITGSEAGYTSLTKTADTASVSKGTMTGTAVIAGTPTVGETLTATPTDWLPAADQYSYAWTLPDGTALGTDATLVVPATAAGHVISLAITGTKAGYEPLTATAGTASVAPGTLTGDAAIDGAPTVGSTLTADTSNWGPGEVALAYSWTLPDNTVLGTDPTLLVPASALGDTITLTVTGTETGYAPRRVDDTTSAVAAADLTGEASITGTPAVGQTLTAVPQNWTPTPDTYDYSWTVDGKVVSTDKTLVVPASAVGKAISLTITGTKTGYSAFTSAPVTVRGVPGTQTGTVTIDGTPQVGETLTGDTSDWMPTPDSCTYAWTLPDGTVLGTDATLVVPASAAGQQITLAVTCTTDGYEPLTETQTSDTVAPGDITGAVSISGTPDVGETLTAVPANWSPSGVSLDYVWTIPNGNGGTTQLGTGPTLVVPEAAIGKKITVAATGTEPGYTAHTETATEAGATTGVITPGTPTISGNAAVGGTLVAAPGTWAPSGVDLSYEWTMPDGTVIGHEQTLIVPSSAAGKTITLTVTGSKSGYPDATADAHKAIAAYAGPSVQRIAGSQRWQTAIAISQDSFPVPGSADVVFVAQGENFPDALSAGPAAVKLNGPLLLTPHNQLLSAVASEIKRLSPAQIVVVGGPTAVNPNVFNALAKIAPTKRIGGVDRYATSLAIAKYAFGSSVGGAYVATGFTFPDALSASAYAGSHDEPVLLVPGWQSSAPSSVRSWLKSAGVSSISVAGGTAAVTAGVANSLKVATGVTPKRFGGANRFETSVLINAQFTKGPAAYLATGLNFPDALAGAAAAGRIQAPLFVVPYQCVPKGAQADFSTWKTGIVKVLGGPAALAQPATENFTRCSF